jgi:hypothetical protein
LDAFKLEPISGRDIILFLYISTQFGKHLNIYFSIHAPDSPILAFA